MRLANAADGSVGIIRRRENKLVLAADTSFLRTDKTSSVIVSLRLAARVFPNGLKILFSMRSIFPISVRNTSSGRIPVSRIMRATSFSGLLAAAK